MTPIVAALWLAAAPPTTGFDWRRSTGAESCSDGQGVARRVEERLGRPAFTAEDPDDVLEVTLSQTEGRWLGHVSLRAPTGALLGERDVQTDKPRCEDLEAALVLVISLTMTPRVRPPLEARALAPEPEPAPPPSTWRLSPRASLTAGYGALPVFSAGAQLAVGLQRGDGWLFELSIQSWLPAWLRGGEGRVRLAPLEGGLAVCPFNPASGRFQAGFCTEVHAGVLWAQGFDYGEVSLRAFPLVSVGPSARLAFALDERWHLHGGLAALLRPYQPEITYRDSFGMRQLISRLSVVVISAELGVSASFQ